MVSGQRNRLARCFLALSLGFLSFAYASCTGYFSSTVYPSYLQRADKTVHFSNILELANLKGEQVKFRSIKGFFLTTFNQSPGTSSSEQVIGVSLRFSEIEKEDILVFFTSDLQFLGSYTRSDFELPYGYKLTDLFSEAYGGRVLVGYTYEGTNPTLQPKLVALDPRGKEPPIVQTITDSGLLYFQGGVVSTQSGNEGTWLAKVLGNTVNFLLLPSDVTPPLSSGNFVQAFDSPTSAFLVSWYVKDPVRNLTAIGLRLYEDKKSYVVFNLPDNPSTIPNFPSLVTPRFSFTDPWNRWVELQKVSSDDFFFYTVEGIALVQEEDSWKFYPFKPISSTSSLAEWTGQIKEGPSIRLNEDLAFYFT
ncbi:MAG: hypothetical protein SNJ78_13180, partial [Spirochaetales bacterium]